VIPVSGLLHVRLTTPVRVRGVAFVYLRDPDGNVVELVDTSRKEI
jgi:catechol 2,3-dioxygenase-like lactoylglutathione lyase family enzyme